MVRKGSPSEGKPLVIVESPAKARTISKFLGPGYTIEASIGHIRDLPAGGQGDPRAVQGRGLGLPGRERQRGFRAGLRRPARARPSRSASSRTCSRTPTTSIWRRTKTAKARPSVGTCARCSSRRCRSTGWCSTKSPRRRSSRRSQHPREHRRGPGPGPGNAADHRPAVRLRGLAAVVAQGAAASCRPAACRAWPCG